MSATGIISIIAPIFAFLLATAATVLSFIFILPEKRKLPGFFRFVRNLFNFRYLVIEKILQALYIFSTIFIILYGFFSLFSFHTEMIYNYGGTNYYGDYYGSYYTEKLVWDGWKGLLMMILGPIFVRIFYEASMMIILLIKNVIQINGKLKNQNENESNADIFALPNFSNAANAPEATPTNFETPVTAQPSATPAKATNCPKCGMALDENGKCPLCD